MSSSLKDGEIEELKLKADIQSVISNYVNLKRTGKSYTGLCPFHNEKTPSFSVDTVKQLYHCFGCGEGGDVISFIQKTENLDFIEAVEFLAKKVGHGLKYNFRGTGESSKIKNRLAELNGLAAKYFSFVLLNSNKGKPSLKYLEERGFSLKTIQEFGIGYSLDSWDNFSNFAAKRGFKAKEIIDTGLAIESRKANSRVYDRFRGRIMFPIEDLVGKTIGFGGRIITGETRSGTQSAKYINTPETKLYSKGKNIYWLSRVKNNIVQDDEVLIVEGYTDVMALAQSGINNVVASLGTALTSDQIKLLGRFTKNIILVFDSDDAGINASLKGIERLKEYNEQLDLYFDNNLNIRVAVLGKGYDPADFIFKIGKEKFLEKIKNAISIIDFTINVIASRHDINNLAGKLKASDSLIRFISSLSSRMIQEECIKKVARKLNLKEDLLLEEMLKKQKEKSNRVDWDRSGSPGKGRSQNEGMVQLKKIEVEALKLIINGPGDKIDNFLELDFEYFRFEDTRKLFSILKNDIGNAKINSKKINFPFRISSGALENEDVRKLYNYILFSEVHYKEEDIGLASSEVLNNLKKIYISGEIDNIRKKMVDIEKEKDSADMSPNKELDDRYDSLYQKLIKLEKDKMNLNIAG